MKTFVTLDEAVLIRITPILVRNMENPYYTFLFGAVQVFTSHGLEGGLNNHSNLEYLNTFSIKCEDPNFLTKFTKFSKNFKHQSFQRTSNIRMANSVNPDQTAPEGAV